MRGEHAGEITIGMLGAGDAQELKRLAERDTRRIPAGELLGARVDHRLVAALSVGSGEAIADPFRPTDGVLELLRERSAQLRGDSRRGLARRIRDRRGRRHSQGALPASPPGAGGRLLEI